MSSSLSFPREDPALDAFLEGALAFRDGKPIERNPYKGKRGARVQRLHWEGGWNWRFQLTLERLQHSSQEYPEGM